MSVQKRKLIEVALPLEVINRESAREKSIRHGHPSTLHLWWARRPLAAARAVLFAQLVDDPSSHPDQFPTEEAQKLERERLHGIIERLVVWENVRDERLLEEARQEILKSTDGNPPPILDPFAGGGSIPLEAQRLGLEAHASDLNPVAVLINKALIEVPPKFRNSKPVFPGLAESEIRNWKGAEGLAADVRAYGQWMRDEAEKRIGSLYPKAEIPEGGEVKVVAWIWARTVTCPNPACGIEMPLVRSWWLRKKKGRDAYVIPRVVDDSTHPSGKSTQYSIGTGRPGEPSISEGTISRGAATCVNCRTTATNDYIRSVATTRGLGSVMIAVVAAGVRTRVYLAPSTIQINASKVDRPADLPDQMVPVNNHDVDRLPMYGMRRWVDAFTNRQLVALTTFADLVIEARKLCLDAARRSDQFETALSEGVPNSADTYADAVATYLGLIPSGLANLNSAITTWRVPAESPRTTFARQLVPMAWDYVESDSLEKSRGVIDRICMAIEQLPMGNGSASQGDARVSIKKGYLISTDPPYYDNIAYSDLSDYFYVWLRRSLRSIQPELTATVLVPKADELVANANRHGGRVGAKTYFEDGFRDVFAKARETADTDAPITVYYAFKQAESTRSETASTGWETLLEGMVGSGWSITATWPMRTEAAGRMTAVGTNALASSIVLALRPRDQHAPTTDRRGFIAALRMELPASLKNLQQGGIAAVDLPQAVIGPGMGIFSRYASVIESDGSKMSVRSALARINEVLDQVLNEQEGDFDPTTRFAIAWYRMHGYGVGNFGDADSLVRARGSFSVESLDRDEILRSRAGKVNLLAPLDLRDDYDVATDDHTSAWEAAHHLMRILESSGIEPAGEFLAAATARADGAVDADLVKELAFLLFSIAEKNGRTKDAISFNTLVTSWPDIVDASRTRRTSAAQQGTLDYEDED